MMKITELWNKFDQLKLWQKILLAIPFFLLTAVIIMGSILFIKKDPSLNDELVKHNKETVDDRIKKSIKTIKTLEKEKKKIILERDQVKKELEAAYENNTEMSKRIASASDNELIDMYKELRRRAECQRGGS